jgi:hypothetical protein
MGPHENRTDIFLVGHPIVASILGFNYFHLQNKEKESSVKKNEFDGIED